MYYQIPHTLLLSPLIQYDTAHLFLSYSDGPVTTNCPRTIEISEGDNLETFCPSEGNPRPTVRWLRDGLSIDPSRPLSREDSSVYTVNVTGLLSFEDTIEVFVMCKCSTG